MEHLVKHYKYTLPSSWYVRIHNKSYANKDTITIPVTEEEYNIISRKTITVTDDDEYTSYSISNPYVLLWQIERYFYGEKTLENILETIKMFAWFNCVSAIKQFDVYDDIIKQEILLLSFKHYNEELLDYVIQYVSLKDIAIFFKKHAKLFKSLGQITKTLKHLYTYISVANIVTKKLLIKKVLVINVLKVINHEIKYSINGIDIKNVLFLYGI
jgi:hypothetical protein